MGRVWMLEWRTAMSRRRLMTWNVVVPLLLLAPIAFSPAAAPHRAAVYSVFFAFFAVFGTCIPLVRDGSSGWVEKQRLTGFGERRWLLERLGASVAIDAIELAPTFALLAVSANPGSVELARAGIGLLVGLVAAALLGAVVASAVRSLAEGALACAGLTLLALHFAGVFRTGPPGTWAEAAQRYGVFRPLAEAGRALAGSSVPAGPTDWWGSLAALVALAAAVLAFAPVLVRRLGGTVAISR